MQGGHARIQGRGTGGPSIRYPFKYLQNIQYPFTFLANIPESLKTLIGPQQWATSKHNKQLVEALLLHCFIRRYKNTKKLMTTEEICKASAWLSFSLKADFNPLF